MTANQAIETAIANNVNVYNTPEGIAFDGKNRAYMCKAPKSSWIAFGCGERFQGTKAQAASWCAEKSI